MFRAALIAAGALALAACSQAAPESDNPQPGAAPSDTGEVASAASAARGPASFVQCKTCHSVEPGRNGIGPSLAGIYGRPAGTVPNYAYSSAMKSARLAWDDATLDRFIEAPMKTVPGTKMVYAGQKDPAKRAELVTYLKTL